MSEETPIRALMHQLRDAQDQLAYNTVQIAQLTAQAMRITPLETEMYKVISERDTTAANLAAEIVARTLAQSQLERAKEWMHHTKECNAYMQGCICGLTAFLEQIK